MHKSQIENHLPEPQTIKELKADGLPSAQVTPNPLLGAELPQGMKERLNCCLSESDNPSNIAGALMNEFTVRELEQVLAMLIGLYDKAHGLLHMFWQRSSDACPLEVSEAESQEKEWFKWMYNSFRV